ncbi:primosomal protein DnaI [Furfurilactobacillus siliginis]|uniref:Primosomal protein DnaI n=1 Tax=Furfurilactobacillus siliginis TaxID=348151 RepID=A0A0R2KY44_9LACO|nr:primosomal protein DnaI [Furfurilactobacillus siliginis]KRN94527.1 primosomal protein DnaI [Furfurilactobacillus siliginis]GEK28568.1 primosomal protein DnaI [Furfurilactobacillus siliginis]
MQDLGRSMQELLNRQQLNSDYQQLITKAVKDSEVQQFIQAHQDELADDALDRGSSKLYEFVSQRDKLRAGQQVFAPGYEPKLVISDHYIEVTYVPTEETLLTQKRALLKKRVRAVSMPKMIERASFNEYDIDGDAANRSAALSQAMQFVADYSQKPREFHQGLYLYGNFGVGKTYLLGAIANELATLGYASTLVHFPSFAVEMKNSIGKNNVAEKVEAIKVAPVLMIDDIGADSMSSWVRDEILGVILEYRMQEELPTFFTSNFSMDLLSDQHLSVNQKGEKEDVKAARLMQRIRFLSHEVRVVGPNRRPQ